ncbi:hypothetical protein LCGC14_0859770 [marine sediment metagenome]|uniref:Uncharacterized protein n=1 Tax=marine sediment metagenome TaxID=412755 RepID=A0A0F9PT36_9ZZZZ
MSPARTLEWLECETPGCWIEEQVADDVTGVKCWRCCLGQIEHLRQQEDEYLTSIAPAAIKTARKRAGLSQKVLAFKLSNKTARVSQSDVSKAERGIADPPNKQVVDWALAQQKGKRAA